VNESCVYQLVRRIGSGPGGPVYLASGAEGEVAIRQFQSVGEVNSDLWRRDRESFLAAGRQQMTLADPSIVPALEVIDRPEDASVVMGYVDAETLQTALRNRRFSPDEINTLLRRAALALDFAHSRGVVHGDLKPSNIFLLPNREIIVGDFAISPRARFDPHQFLPLNLMHGYLSPEHFNFPVALEARSDQYSLAVIAYEMYTGHMPFGIAPDYLTAVLTEEMAPSRINPKLPPSVDAPLMRALSRNPAHRFSSCMEFISDLSAKVTKVPDMPAEKRGIPLLVFGLAGLLVLIAGFLIFRPGKKLPPVVAQEIVQPAPVTVTNPVLRPKNKRDAAKGNHKVITQVAALTQEPKPKPFSGTRPAVAPRTEGVGITPKPADSAAAPIPAVTIKTQVLSRTLPIQKGSSFAMGDPVMGELGHGDLKAMVEFDGPLPRPRLTMEWKVNGTVTDSQKPVPPNQVVEYNNQPIPGLYMVTIRLDGRPVEQFVFRITP
jgi:serine/threonine protein kinase